MRQYSAPLRELHSREELRKSCGAPDCPVKGMSELELTIRSLDCRERNRERAT